MLPQFHGHTEHAAPASHGISYPVPTNDITGRGSVMGHNFWSSIIMGIREMDDNDGTREIRMGDS